MQLQEFWDGLTPTSRRTLSNTSGGLLIKKTPEDIVAILDELSEDANQWPSEIAERRRSTGVHQVDTNISVQVQLDVMAKEIRKLTLASIHNEPHAACDICGRGHPTHECQASMEEVNVSSPGGTTDERLDAHGAAIKELGTGLRNLERQVGQISTVLSERIPESGKELKIEDDDKKTEKKKGKKGVEKKKKEETSRREDSDDGSKHMPTLPFPQKLYRKKLDKQFERFLDMLRQVNVNLPFTDVLSQMPSYAKFLKECGDPGSFTIPYSLGTLNFDKSLSDFGASINLMSFSIHSKLEKEIGEIRFHSGEYGGEHRGPPHPRAILDIHDRKLILRVGEETVTFEINVATAVKKEKPAASV
ncbi:uncharacterized protein [Nicotiana tomentosiformis]|uniref:uncharacterized protein n=1 Tax=Nicotiana tomentosiformis TaxID=4098 RepID=UPI00388C7388